MTHTSNHTSVSKGRVPIRVGFIAKRTVEWLDQLLAGHPSVRRNVYKAVFKVLARHEGKMLLKFKETLA